MTQREKTVQKLLTADAKSITFKEFTSGLKSLGFKHDRTSGSHQIWINVEHDIAMNIQPKGKMAKPYQIKQFRSLWK